MAARDELLRKLETVTTAAGARFLKYYYMPADERPSWDEYKTCCTTLMRMDYESCLKWLDREDIQRAMQIYRKYHKLGDLTKLYESMYAKALRGDTRAADWVLKFMDSEYFDESSDEINDFLNGINIPVKGGG